MRKRATELNELEEGGHALYVPTGLDQPHSHSDGHKPSKQVFDPLLGFIANSRPCHPSAVCFHVRFTEPPQTPLRQCELTHICSLCWRLSKVYANFQYACFLPVTQDRTLLQDTPNMLVLVLLYMMQGVPLGLTMGAM